MSRAKATRLPRTKSQKERNDLEVFEMKGLRSMCGVSLRDRVRNVRIREICGGGKRFIE